MPTSLSPSDVDAPAAPTAAPVAPHNVPPALSSFVGRAEERTSLAQALAAARLVTVTGPGGAGKTRLAREVAIDAAVPPAGASSPFAGGVYWVELVPVSEASAVAPAIAAALGVRPSPGRDVVEAITEALRGSAVAPTTGASATVPSGGPSRRTLLVLDNCEHVIAEAAMVAERLLRTVPGLTVLATSREALAIEGEQAWVLPPLASPPRPVLLPRSAPRHTPGGPAGGATAGGTPTGTPAAGAPAALDVAALADYEAVRLFVERARAVSPGFALTARSAPAVATITARLDGLPLALELAAASVGALGVDQVAARLDDVFGLLTRGRRTALPRHRTLRALLDWSYELLSPAERTLLARLGVFRGPFPLDAAEIVGGAGDGDARPDGAPREAHPDATLPDGTPVLDALGRLVEQSLVEAVGEEDGSTRFRLLETVKQYALARLAETPAEAEAARARHAAWVVARTEAAKHATWSPARGRTVAQLAQDVDEIRAALDWSTAHAPMRAVRIGGALAWFWYTGVPWPEARARTGAALAAADAEGIPDAARGPRDQAALAELLYPISGLAYFAGDADAILDTSRRALALWDVVDRARATDPALDGALAAAAVRGRSVQRQQAGLGHAMRGEFDAALTETSTAIEIARAGGARWMEAVMRSRHALVTATVGRPDAALDAYAVAVPQLRAVGERWFLSLALEGMAAVERTRGALQLAAVHARESVAVLADEPDPWFVSRSLDTLAGIAMAAIARAEGGADPAEQAARATTAARLLGTAAGLRTRCGADVIGPDRERHAATVAATRAAIGDAAFDAAWEQGAALDLAGAFALAASADVVSADVPDAASRDGADVRDATPRDATPRDATPRDVAPGEATTAGARGAGTRTAAAARPEATSASATRTTIDGSAPALGIRALGPLLLTRDGAPIPPGTLPAGKVTELLLYLVLHPEGRTKEEIGLALWPDASTAQVRGSFHVALHRLRTALAGGRDGAERSWVAVADGRYALRRTLPVPDGLAGEADAPRLACDVDDLLAAIDLLTRAERRQQTLDAEALGRVERALDAERGELAQGLALGDWIVAHQDRLSAAWGDGLLALARQHARAGRQAESARVLEALVARDPLRESAHRELMTLWAAGGERARALAHYEELVALLAREVGVPPSRETQRVAERIRAQ